MARGKRDASGERATDRPIIGILFKIASVIVFIAMSSFIKASGAVPSGQIAFYRSFFAILPIIIFLGYQGELRHGWKTARPLGHFYRGLCGALAMSFSFYALTRLPLPEAITLGYAQPLLIVAFSAIFLHERVRAYRWSAVIIGMVGVAIVSWPKLAWFNGAGAIDDSEAAGIAAALIGASLSAVAALQVRSLVATESSATIVLWFSVCASVLALATIPFGWASLTGRQAMLLILAGLCGGVAQIFMTEGYRYAPASILAPFDYVSLALGLAIGYAVFSEVPTIHMLIGAAIIVASGIFIIWRESRLDLQRGSARKVTPPQ